MKGIIFGPLLDCAQYVILSNIVFSSSILSILTFLSFTCQAYILTQPLNDAILNLKANWQRHLFQSNLNVQWQDRHYQTFESSSLLANYLL